MRQSELLELVEELREMAAAAPTAKVHDALTKMADRYAARATRAGRLGCSGDFGRSAHAAEWGRPAAGLARPLKTHPEVRPSPLHRSVLVQVHPDVAEQRIGRPLQIANQRTEGQARLRRGKRSTATRSRSGRAPRQ
jgi:hypothetical protein